MLVLENLFKNGIFSDISHPSDTDPVISNKLNTSSSNDDLIQNEKDEETINDSTLTSQINALFSDDSGTKNILHCSDGINTNQSIETMDDEPVAKKVTLLMIAKCSQFNLIS